MKHRISGFNKKGDYVTSCGVIQINPNNVTSFKSEVTCEKCLKKMNTLTTEEEN